VGRPPAGDRRVTGDALESDLLDVAHAAARAAGEVLVPAFARTAEGVGTKTTPTDLVSAADLRAEQTIRALLAERRPGDAVLGEEGGETAAAGGGSGVRWIVDPLDGTVNFLFGYPQWSVSVACEDGEGTIAGVVYDPLREEEFAATRSGPALLDGRVIARPERDGGLPLALVATGFAYDAAIRTRQSAVLARVLPGVRDVRRGGSAALDLAWTAAGRCDAYFERGVQPWDVAAGALVCARAGLVVRELPANDDDPVGLLVAPPALIDPLHALVAPSAS
jgi:myo-inositol-1(or 4)-monophosphatase